MFFPQSAFVALVLAAVLTAPLGLVSFLLTLIPVSLLLHPLFGDSCTPFTPDPMGCYLMNIWATMVVLGAIQRFFIVPLLSQLRRR